MGGPDGPLTPCTMLWFLFRFPGIMANPESHPNSSESTPLGTVYVTLSLGGEQGCHTPHPEAMWWAMCFHQIFSPLKSFSLIVE